MKRLLLKIKNTFREIKRTFPDKRMNTLYKQFRRFSLQAENVNDHRFTIKWENRYPCLDDADTTPSFGEYFYHLAWAARRLAALNPQIHYDISSHNYFVGVLSAFIPVKYFEFRHLPVNLSGLQTESADLCRLPFEDYSVSSLSCMHTVEHIGLGRYGDPIDYTGDKKAMDELKRVMAPNGNLLFVVPVGTPSRVEFNAHRIYNISEIRDYFSDEFTMEDLSVCITDANGKWELVDNVKCDFVENCNYAVACFHFKRIPV